MLIRLQIHDAGLVQELKDTAEEFSRRGEFQVHLHVDALAFQLSASEQKDLLVFGYLKINVFKSPYHMGI